MRSSVSNEVHPLSDSGRSIAVNTSRNTDFSSQPQLSAKEFLIQKEPQTDIDRVVCLAFYLTYYRDTPHFKTIDITNLNREAAHTPFSNAAYAVQNATNQGYLVAAGQSKKQMTPLENSMFRPCQIERPQRPCLLVGSHDGGVLRSLPIISMT